MFKWFKRKLKVNANVQSNKNKGGKQSVKGGITINNGKSDTEAFNELIIMRLDRIEAKIDNNTIKARHNRDGIKQLKLGLGTYVENNGVSDITKKIVKDILK